MSIAERIQYRHTPGKYREGSRLEGGFLVDGASSLVDARDAETGKAYMMTFKGYEVEAGSRVLRLVDVSPPLIDTDLKEAVVLAEEPLKKDQPFNLSSRDTELARSVFVAASFRSTIEPIETQ